MVVTLLLRELTTVFVALIRRFTGIPVTVAFEKSIVPRIVDVEPDIPMVLDANAIKSPPEMVVVAHVYGVEVAMKLGSI